MKKTVLSLCDWTGNMVLPWAEAGYKCVCVDTDPKPDHLFLDIQHHGRDVRYYLPPKLEYSIVFAFPPCTHTAVSGAKWFKAKGPAAAADAFSILAACLKICEWAGAPWMIENLVSTFSTYWRKPDYTFDPCDYGDPYTKKTCLWTGGGFIMPPKNRVEPTDGSKMHLMAPSDDRQRLRSETPMGFARAVFEANHK